MRIATSSSAFASSTAALPSTPPAADLVGSVVLRATFADNGGVVRDVRATSVAGQRGGYASMDDALRAARLYQRVVPSKQFGDQAIAVVRDETTRGLQLLVLDQTLSTFEGREWWEATSWSPMSDRVVAVIQGFGRLVPRG